MSRRLTLLGRASLSIVEDDGEKSVSIEPKRLALLAYLARPQPGTLHPRGEVVSLFWPELSESASRNALRQSLHYLRDRIGEECLTGFGRQRIGLEPGEVTCDAARFEACLEEDRPAAALRLYRGEFLEGFSASDSVPLDRWIEDERTRLRQTAIEATLQMSRTRREEQDYAGALHWVRRGREMTPYEERLVRSEIRLRGAMGEFAEATRVFREYRDRLREDLGAEPSEKTRQLAEDFQRDLPTRSMKAIRQSRELFERVRNEIERSVDLVGKMHGRIHDSIDRRDG